jgi:hypothetical protein
MNLELFGAILAYIGLIWSVLSIVGTFIYYFKGLTSIGRRVVTIHLEKQIITFVISLVYIIVYHIS